MSVFDQSLQQIHEELKKGQTSVTDLVQASLGRIEEVDGKINAFLTLDTEGALAKAKELDEQLVSQEKQDDVLTGHQNRQQRGLLFGLPIGIKDNISTQGLRTTCASKLLDNFTPVYNANVMDKLNDAQAVMIGKMNMDEFAMGSSNENSGYEPVHNPWNLEHVPGGSSGGSAAAVAAGEVYFSLGSDTGGSIRQPAAFCGVVGLKPTYGLVSRYGLVAYASSLDQIGPLTKNVEDAAYLLQVLAGYDNKDSTSVKVDIPDYISALGEDVEGLVIGVPKEYFGEGIHTEVKEGVRQALRVLEGLGATLKEVSLPRTEDALPAYYIISSSEASSNLARFDGIRYGVRAQGAENLLDLYKRTRSEGFGREVKRRIMLGTHSLSSGYYDAYYVKAVKARKLVQQDFHKAFEQCDVIIGPTTPTTAFKIGEKTGDATAMYNEDILTCPVNMAGIPAMSVPCGFDGQGLPIGMQIMSKHFDESTMLRVAHAYEQQTDHHLSRPNV